MADFAKYVGDGRHNAFRIPFEYEDKAEVGASIIGRDGLERRLALNRDYYIVRDMAILEDMAAGDVLLIWREDRPQAVALVAREPEISGPVYDGRIASAAQEAAYSESQVQGSGQEIEAAASEAVERIEKAAQEAQGRIAELTQVQAGAQEDLAGMRALADSFEDYAKTCMGRIHKACGETMRLAAQVSQYNRMPGIAAVRTIEEIPFASTGFFVVNPHLSHGPSPFMGLWPVRSVAEMRWDGCFIIAKPYGPQVMLPGAPPPPHMRRMKGKGDGDDWVPCEHDHRPHCWDSILIEE